MTDHVWTDDPPKMPGNYRHSDFLGLKINVFWWDGHLVFREPGSDRMLRVVDYHGRWSDPRAEGGVMSRLKKPTDDELIEKLREKLRTIYGNRVDYWNNNEIDRFARETLAAERSGYWRQ